VTKNEAEKFVKCKHLTIGIHCIWNVTTRVIPIIRGSTGTHSNLLRKYLSNVTRKRHIQEPNKTTTMSTAHILR